MAEVLGLVASVIQVAGTGLKLSQALYEYAEGVSSADRRIKDIAKEIELTSFVIEELGSVFKDDETSHLISKNAVKTANETMKECSTVFAEIEATLKKSKKNTFGRLMLPFRDHKIELLRNHIDKLKSTLQLLMQVLTHAHHVASKNLDREAEKKQREEIKELLENKKRSTKKYEESLIAYSLSDGTTVIEDDLDLNKENGFGAFSLNLASVAATVAPTVTSSMNAETLANCVQHVRRLLEHVEALERVVTDQVDVDHRGSEHHRNVEWSYSLARAHLDNIFSENTKGLGIMQSEDAAIELEENQINTFKSSTGSIINQEITRSNTLVDTDIKFKAKTMKRKNMKGLALNADKQESRVEEEAERAQRQSETRVEAKELKTQTDIDETKIELQSQSHPLSQPKAPLKFNDAVGRKFSFPFHLCSTWRGMFELIEQSFLHVDVLRPHVSNGHYELKDADGYIILPQAWESTIQPGMVVSMHLWPLPEIKVLQHGAFVLPTSPLPDFAAAFSGYPSLNDIKSKKEKKKKRKVKLEEKAEDESSGASIVVDSKVYQRHSSKTRCKETLALVDDVELELDGELIIEQSSFHSIRDEDLSLDIGDDGLGLSGREEKKGEALPAKLEPERLAEHEQMKVNKTEKDFSTTLQEIEIATAMMQANIDKVHQRGDRLDALHDKTDSLPISAQGFRRGAQRQRAQGLWNSVYDFISGSFSPKPEKLEFEDNSIAPGSSFPGTSGHDIAAGPTLSMGMPIHVGSAPVPSPLHSTYDAPSPRPSFSAPAPPPLPLSDGPPPTAPRSPVLRAAPGFDSSSFVSSSSPPPPPFLRNSGGYSWPSPVIFAPPIRFPPASNSFLPSPPPPPPLVVPLAPNPSSLLHQELHPRFRDEKGLSSAILERKTRRKGPLPGASTTTPSSYFLDTQAEMPDDLADEREAFPETKAPTHAGGRVPRPPIHLSGDCYTELGIEYEVEKVDEKVHDDDEEDEKEDTQNQHNKETAKKQGRKGVIADEHEMDEVDEVDDLLREWTTILR